MLFSVPLPCHWTEWQWWRHRAATAKQPQTSKDLENWRPPSQNKCTQARHCYENKYLLFLPLALPLVLPLTLHPGLQIYHKSRNALSCDATFWLPSQAKACCRCTAKTAFAVFTASLSAVQLLKQLQLLKKRLLQSDAKT